jgi:hypothetical protein
MKNPFNKYNSLKWCNYPFHPEPLGYCWSYANWMDAGEKPTIKTCKDCEFFRERRIKKPRRSK